jgi:hypothetical protein
MHTGVHMPIGMGDVLSRHANSIAFPINHAHARIQIKANTSSQPKPKSQVPFRPSSSYPQSQPSTPEQQQPLSPPATEATPAAPSFVLVKTEPVEGVEMLTTTTTSTPAEATTTTTTQVAPSLAGNTAWAALSPSEQTHWRSVKLKWVEYFDVKSLRENWHKALANLRDSQADAPGRVEAMSALRDQLEKTPLPPKPMDVPL